MLPAPVHGIAMPAKIVITVNIARNRAEHAVFAGNKNGPPERAIQTTKKKTLFYNHKFLCLFFTGGFVNNNQHIYTGV